MRPPDAINHFQRDQDGLLQDPLAPVDWAPDWDGYGRQPLPGLDVFGPISREATTPHDGEQGIAHALYRLLYRERQRRAGWSMLWIYDHTRTGRCAGITVRAWDDDGGMRTLHTLEEAFLQLGFRVKRTALEAPDPARFTRKERIA